MCSPELALVKVIDVKKKFFFFSKETIVKQYLTGFLTRRFFRPLICEYASRIFEKYVARADSCARGSFPEHLRGLASQGSLWIMEPCTYWLSSLKGVLRITGLYNLLNEDTE